MYFGASLSLFGELENEGKDASLVFFLLGTCTKSPICLYYYLVVLTEVYQSPIR